MRRRAAPFLAALIVLSALAGCSGEGVENSDDGPTAATTPSTDADDLSAMPSTTHDGDGPHEDDDRSEAGTPTDTVSAVETFYAWLEASRAPSPEEACGYLTPELQQRMLDEFEASGFTAGTCEELTAATAELYRAAGTSAEVEVQIVTESADETVLFVTYADGGDCGTVVLEPAATGWLINENSEGCDAP